MKKINNSENKITDMPKIKSPFVREERNGGYYCTDKVEEGYEWVFENDDVIATEKLHGTNVSIIIENGHINSVWNRENRIQNYPKQNQFIIKGILNSIKRGYTELKDGQWFGELVGPKVNGNPYNLDKHYWIPFRTYCWEKLKYESWGKYPKNFDSIKKWFSDGLIPLFYSKIHGLTFKEAEEQNAFTEGIVFVSPDGKLAKLRHDMFEKIEED